MSLDVKWVGALHWSEGRQGHSVEAIVPHIMEGSLQSCDNWFTSPDSSGSTHYGVGGKEVHQYVAEGDTAWSVGNWQGNLRTISIEHAGTTYDPPTFETVQTGAKLMADIASRLGWTELVLGKNVKLHRWYSDTSCPASLDYTTEIRLANEYLKGKPAKIDDVEGGIYRLYNPNSGHHMFTASPKERDYLVTAGWRYEGVGWKEPEHGGFVYRSYNPNNGEHVFTASENEYRELTLAGWIGEGVAFLSDEENHAQPVHRLYDGRSHMYTASNSERKTLLNGGVWRSEGVGFYGAVR